MIFTDEMKADFLKAQEERKRLDKIEADFMSDLIKSFKEKYDYSYEAAPSIVKLIEAFDYDKKECYGIGSQMSFTSVMDLYIKNKMDGHTLELVSISNYLLENNHTSEDNKFEIGFGDRYVYLIEAKDPKRRAMVFENQNINCVFIIEKSAYSETEEWLPIFGEKIFPEYKLHIRSIYEELEDVLNDEDSYLFEEAFELADVLKGMTESKDIVRHVVKNLGHFMGYGFTGWYGEGHPTLKDFIKHDFTTSKERNFNAMEYKDSRDSAYVYSSSNDGGDYIHLKRTGYLSSEIMFITSAIFNPQE